MNIAPQANQLPLATVVNPPTDNLRRENSLRDVISQPAALSQSAAEKGVASEKERVRTPAQAAEEGFDFAAIQERAERARSRVNERQPGEGNQQQESAEQGSPEQKAEQSENKRSDQTNETSNDANELTEQERQEVRDLELRHQEVIAHEQAHSATGGRYTGAPSYSYEVGPNGKRYAVEGEVSVDLSKPGSPEETVSKMRKVYDAALAPANPSAQDLRVAAKASSALAQAQTELLQERITTSAEEAQENDLSKPLGDNSPEIESFNAEASEQKSQEFDQFIASTLKSQEQTSPERDQSVDERASRIETFYLNINQAYERPPRHHFELQA
ncbi:putative metalloprotease CJM1_0395 family protein [Colwellia sp. MEBiC06753]